MWACPGFGAQFLQKNSTILDLIMTDDDYKLLKSIFIVSVGLSVLLSALLLLVDLYR